MLAPQFSPFPWLQTERTVLRPMEVADAPALFNLRTNDQVMRYLDRKKPETVQEMVDFIARINKDLVENNGINWAISLKNDPRLIGVMGFWRLEKEHFRGEIGYMLMPEFQGKGIMQEVIHTTLEYGFRHLGLHSVEANVNPANQPSIRLLEKNGFIREAYFKENYYFNGRFLDSAIYCLLAQNFQA